MILKSVLILASFLAITFGEFPLIPNPLVLEPREDDLNYRLPNDTIPISYDVTLEPTFDPDFNFSGIVIILVRVIEATDVITLHGNDIEILPGTTSVTSQTVIGVELADGEPELDATLHFIKISLNTEVQPGTVLRVYMEYTGILNEENTGFYKARYEENGVTKWFGTTQMEATYARQAFPCYDEPALKATFIIRLVRPENYNSISNMPLVDSQPQENGKVMDIFEETVVMSTYLVAFVVSEMDHVAQGIQTVYGEPALIADGRGEYGLQKGIEILAVMEEFTGIEYSLSKLDQISIPDDWFTFGAMENWGLVTYRDRYLLFKEGLSMASEKQNVASIIAHELGHQWFGNLVSPLWWTYIWLNEGFATYFEYYATSVVEPTMRLMEQYVVLSHQNAMESDSLRSTRPMTHYAQTPGEIIALFDRIAYDKSGSVIRMMEHFLTTEIFKRGLNIYLNNMAYQAAEPNDLWAGLQAGIDEINPNIIPEPLADIMDTWSSQAGYPVVTVERNGERIILTQSRFLLLETTHDLDTKWTIPINYATASNADFSNTLATYWLKDARDENTGITVDENDWIILNKQETGYYRVNYDENNWRLIINYLNSDDFEKIHVLNRAQLIDDALNMARSGRLSYDIVLDLLRYISRETDYIPLRSFFRGLTFLNKHLLNSDKYDLFQRFVREILQKAYESLGTADTGEHTVKLNRINVLTWLCRYEHADCVQATHARLSALVPEFPDLQSTVYCSGLIEDTNIETKFNSLYNRYKANDIEYLERNRIIAALGCVRSETQLNRFDIFQK
ncbi:protease m1 zinc metalloprotease [Holotrichia oblita]|uniref:Protease m1 zinc metalloprotease n=1 Tax=Holotrichia oblita TaxID=644536 RepID=A0ACB9SZP0_HOLOL|nr:protease m1 zinc metalloprotease [Holotrichia oblita]